MTDHGMDRCHFMVARRDALHAVLCDASYNIRWLLRLIVKKGSCLLQACGLA
jgi:IS5 family transposase